MSVLMIFMPCFFKLYLQIPVISIFQVHRAVLHNGERVAVKVQRPGLRKLFDIDLSKRHVLLVFLSRELLLI